jgi:hypothetical protein
MRPGRACAGRICPNCGRATLEPIATILARDAIDRVLAAIGLQPRAPPASARRSAGSPVTSGHAIWRPTRRAHHCQRSVPDYKTPSRQTRNGHEPGAT